MIQQFFRLSNDFGCSSIIVGYISKNSCFRFGQPMIDINSRIDQRIAQSFPNDPYSNLCVVTSTHKLHLQHAFLSMDSVYFSQISPDASQVKLLELQQIPLLKVLHALYGAPLVAENCEDLDSLLHIIHYLGIQQYCRNIEEAIKKKKDILQSVEFIEVSHKYQLLWEDVLEFHIGNEMKVLANEKAFLQLGKVSEEAFTSLIIGYAIEKGVDGQRMLNRVMENYFNRKEIRPMVFLAQSNLKFLRSIWVNNHHISSPQPFEQVKKQDSLSQKLMLLSQLQQANKNADRQIQILNLKITKLRQDLCIMTPTPNYSQILQTQVKLPQQLPLLRTQTSLQARYKCSPQRDSFISSVRSPERMKGKILKRFGAKNLKRWT